MEGKEEGRKQEAIRVARDMLKEGFDEKVITKLTRVTKGQIYSFGESERH